MYVIQIARKTNDYEYMVCSDEKSRLYDVIKVIDYNMLCEIMPLLNEQRKNKKFTDLKDCFSQNNVFYAIFSHNDDRKLSDYLKKSEYNAYERLEILKNLTEKIVMMDISPALQTDILMSENICISDSMNISFIYDLEHIPEYKNLNIADMQKTLLCLTKKILEKEYKSSELDEYYSALEKGSYSRYLEIYSGYMKAYEDIKNNLNEETLKKQSKWMKIWEKIKAVLKLAKPFAVCLIIILALLYLLFTALGYDREDKSQYSTYKSIGSLIIKEYDEQKGN